MNKQQIPFPRKRAFAVLFTAATLSVSQFQQAPLSAQDTDDVLVDNSGWVEVGSDRIFYEEVGSGPAIILIHDGLVNREIWDAQMPVLSRDYRAIRYDRRGYGASSAPTEAYSNVDDLNALFEYLNLEEACLIAMSSGGRLAIDFTLEHPEKVNSLILVGAVVGGFSYTQHFYDRGGHLPPDLSMNQRRMYHAADDPYEIYSENVAAKQRVIDLVSRYPSQGHGSFPDTRPLQPAITRLNEIDVPALVLVGEFDIPDVHAHAGAINAGIKNSKREIISKAGHLIPIEQPESFNRAMLDFLGGIVR
jgi:3-oxoadipate enol-lactonase